MYDAVIIGAGVVGGMIARKLSEYKMRVCILEKETDVAMGATRANSAIVHAGFDAKEGTLKAKLNVRGSQMMKQVTEDLGVKYRQNGSLVIGFNEADRQTIQGLLERGRKNGVEGLEIIEGERLFTIEPSLSKNVTCALYAPTGAITCPYELTIAAIGNAMDNGVELKLNFEVTGIKRNDNYYEISSDTETIKSKIVINAAGIYSDKIAEMIGDTSFNIHPRAGEYILLDKECGTLVSHTIFRTPTKLGKGILVSPTVDGNLLAGPTSEDKSDKSDKKTTQNGLSKIMREAAENVDGIRFNKSITSFCGLRAVGSTGDFIINSPLNGFINVAGIESPGLTAAPAIAEYVFDMLSEKYKFEPNLNYNPTRKSMTYFRDADIDEKNRMIKKNPSYGKIVCRCEGITEGEIIDAITTNPKATDLDGIKRRTRAQMGRCQGGFCSPSVIELLSERLGIPYEKVTKCGGKSIVNVNKTKAVNVND